MRSKSCSTNGTIPAPAAVDWICVSPKSGAKLAVTSGHEIKLVSPQAGVDPAGFEALAFEHVLLPRLIHRRLTAQRHARTPTPPWLIALRIHGHSYRAEVTLRGPADQVSGMVVDLGLFQRLLAETRGGLDHRFLDDIPDLGLATLANLAKWIWQRLCQSCPMLLKVAVFRDSKGQSCTHFGPGEGSGRMGAN